MVKQVLVKAIVKMSFSFVSVVVNIHHQLRFEVCSGEADEQLVENLLIEFTLTFCLRTEIN